MSKFQYRLKVNGTIGSVLDTCPSEQWTKICEVVEARGGIATFERRLITDHDILSLLTDPTGFVKLDGNVIVCPWDTIAEIEVR